MDAKSNYMEDEEDGRTLTISAGWDVRDDYKHAPTSPHALHGMDLDLTLAARKSDGTRSHTGVQEESILVVFDLPDGSQGESLFRLGQTVEVLKSFVECEYGIPMQAQTLYLDDKIMLDPLSLLDYPEAKGVEELCVRVDGPLTNEYKK